MARLRVVLRSDGSALSLSFFTGTLLGVIGIGIGADIVFVFVIVQSTADVNAEHLMRALSHF